MQSKLLVKKGSNEQKKQEFLLFKKGMTDRRNSNKNLEESTVDLHELAAGEVIKIPNPASNMKHSPSFYAALFEDAKRSPMAAVGSVCALFMVIVASIVVTALFTPCKSSS